jgi:molybdopterin molybdotransferase
MTHGRQDPFFDVRMRGFRDRAEVTDVLRLLDERVRPLTAEVVPLTGLVGRILAEPVVSLVNVPGFARAAMDGYAVRAEDTFGAEPGNPRPLVVLGESFPARPYAGDVGPGRAVRIMTGAPVPDGADAVLPAEAVEGLDGGRVLARDSVPPGRHVGRVGEDVAVGREVLPAGRRLRPQDVGLLAAIGMASAAVVRRPRVAILATGDELLPPGSVPQGYRIVDSNSPMLAALVARDGGLDLPPCRLADRYETVRYAIATSEAELVLVTGGSSVGAEDHAPRAVVEVGELAVHGVALRPASPTGLGFLPGDRVVVLLPGNPVSCLCAYDLFAGRAVRRLGGRGPDLPYRTAILPLASKIVSAVGRVDYVRVRTTPGGVDPVAVGGAGILSTTVAADGFVLVDRDREGYAPGESVEVFLYD